MPNILLHLTPAALYAALGAACWARKAPARLHLQVLLLAALCAHAWELGDLLFGNETGLSFGYSSALSLTLWLAMLIYWLESLLKPLRSLLRYAAPIASLACLNAIFVVGHPQIFAVESWAFKIHIIVAMLAYSLATLGVFHALLLAAAEHNLHSARISYDNDLPPLMVLDALLFRLIYAAFAFLTLTVGSGLLFSEEIFGQPISFNQKTILGIASWILFATLLIGHKYFGWRGKTATRLLLAGFAALVLAYAGSRFILEIIMGRSM